MSRRPIAALLAVLCLLAPAVSAGAAAAQPDAACPHRTAPPPPVDTSENPKPGQPVPGPIPVPAQPVGGTRLGECGLVLPEGAPPLPAEATSLSWVLADLDSGEVLAARDPHARHRPASLIKVLLAIVVLEHLKMDTVVVGTQLDANQDGTKVGVGPEGQYTVKQLLFALLMRSGNDAAHALARQFGGVPQTLEKMNETARRLGALDTRAATPSGLDGPGMSTSAYDLGLLFRAAMKHPEFAEAIATKGIDFPGYGPRPGYRVTNDNRLLGSYPGFLGGKTGFTDDARHTYIGAASQNGHKLVIVLMRGEQQPVRVADQAAKQLDWGFGLFKGKATGVGKLVTAAPETSAPKTAEAPAASTAAGGSAAAASGGTPASTANPLLIIGLTSGGVLLLCLLLWRFRRRAAPVAAPAAESTDPLPALKDQ